MNPDTGYPHRAELKCPHCGDTSGTVVKDTRGYKDRSAIRRRRECLACGGRFTTMERMEIRERKLEFE